MGESSERSVTSPSAFHLRRGGADEIQEFLHSCKTSPGQAYANFKSLLQQLESPESRPLARVFLAEVEDLLNKEHKGVDYMATYNFRIHELALCAEGWEEQTERQKLTLLELPGIFVPEEWSFTFFEGLSRFPESEFRDRDLCELGCGNGWVSLALAERWAPRKVIGLDINPRAIRCAQINLYLNAVHPDGKPALDREGKTLLDRVEFHTSDLLKHCRDNNILLDRIVGCIPQILNPDPAAMSKIVSENESEEFLYALSNYCGLQGFVEDQFGLGLIARALEEAIEAIKPSGTIIMNMGGRPGQAVLDRLYSRRGFNIRKVWQTRVGQAADTDILALVEIERNNRHRFEFFMGPVGVNEPISARTAWAFAKAGGSIYHGLQVYEARLRQPNAVKAIFRFLAEPTYDETRSALDLAFDNESVADEKVAFLAHLARTLSEADFFPYEHTAGSVQFRKHLATFLRLYYRVPITAASIVVQPNRTVMIENVLTMYAPKLALVDASLTKGLPRRWLSAAPPPGSATPRSAGGPVVIEAPTRVDLALKLVEALRPQCVIVAIQGFEVRTTTAFEQLLEATAKIGARLFVDISEHLDLSSLPGANGVLEYMAHKALPQHAALICGLVKNQVYADLEVCFAISENRDFLRALAGAGELTFSRSPILAQAYYQCLLHELLAFQIPDRRHLTARTPQPEDPSFAGKLVPLTPNARQAFLHPSVENIFYNDAESGERAILRMDYGENCLPSPKAVKRFVFEGFARQNLTDAETDPRPEILALLKRRFGLLPEKALEVVLGDGVAPLFARLAAVCAEEGGTLFYPTGMYGAFTATALLYGASTRPIATKKEELFKLTPHAFEEALKETKALKPWLILVCPTVNPTGAVYKPTEIAALLEVARWNGVRVILDTTFSGLEFPNSLSEPTPPSDPSLEASLTPPSYGGAESSYAVVVLGGVSKEFSAGGLRFGYAVVRDLFFLEMLKQGGLSRPHLTLRYAMKKLLAQRLASVELLEKELAEHCRVLEARAKTLTTELQSCGWDTQPSAGGLFLVSSPVSYLGKELTYKTQAGDSATVKLDSKNLPSALVDTTGLLINNSVWTGIDGYCRFVLSVEEDNFQQAMSCLQNFRELVLGQK